jgi:hypothetical protein
MITLFKHIIGVRYSKFLFSTLFSASFLLLSNLYCRPLLSSTLNIVNKNVAERYYLSRRLKNYFLKQLNAKKLDGNGMLLKK